MKVESVIQLLIFHLDRTVSVRDLAMYTLAISTICKVGLESKIVGAYGPNHLIVTNLKGFYFSLVLIS